jgi:hypothetical protein
VLASSHPETPLVVLHSQKPLHRPSPPQSMYSPGVPLEPTCWAWERQAAPLCIVEVAM